MISEELKQIVDKLNIQGEMSFNEGVNSEQIELFEKEHKVNLPQKFKEWLQYSDGGECFLPAGVQFYGILHKPLIDVNYDDRPSNDYIVIGALCTGDPILCKKNEEKIYIYNHEAGKIEDDEVYSDFFAFLGALYELLGIGG